MKCHICDKELSEKEIVFNEELDGYEPCPECLDIIYEAAYGSGFDPDDDNVTVIEADEPTLNLLYSTDTVTEDSVDSG